MARTTVYNPTVTEEKWGKVNKENKILLDDFIEYLESIDRSELTIKNYISDIKIAFIWSLENAKNKHFTEFTKRDFMKYQNYLLKIMKVSSNRIRRMRSSLSSMANFIENVLDDDYPDFRNIVNKIEAPVKTAIRKKTILKDEQIQELLDRLIFEEKYQQACALALAWASGSRKSELLRFKISYFSNDNIHFGSLYRTPETIKTKGRGGKMGKQLHKWSLVSKIKPYLELWIKEREALEVPNEFKDELFISKRNGVWQSMKESTLSSWAENFSKRLNVDFYFHCLRHNFTTGLAQAGLPASVIKEIVGWESVEMVSIYDDTELSDKLGDYFGEEGIKKVEKKSLSDL